MWFRLARQLGKSVKQAQKEIDSKEFAEWIVYNRMSPGDPERSDYNFAQLCALLANIHKSKGKSYGIDDFRLDFAKEASVTKDSEDLKQKLLLWKNTLPKSKVEKRKKR